MGKPTCRGWPRRPGLSLLTAGAVLGGSACRGDNLSSSAPTGSIEITTITSGPEPDADGYAVSIDDGTPAPLGPNATLQRDDLGPGSHSVRLTGAAANCSVGGENPRTVSVPAGGTAPVNFQVTCTASTGSLEVITATSGPSLDQDGYVLMLDGKPRLRLGVSAAVTFAGLTPGSHLVGLSGVAANCEVREENPLSVTVGAGAGTTVDFTITCS